MFPLNQDKDIVTSQEYDAAGNLVRSVDAAGRVTFTVYDSLNRPVKTVRSAKSEASLALGTEPENDPRSESYQPSTEPDRDLMDLTEYDAMGRVTRTRRLLDNRGSSELWEVNLFGYDALGQQVKTIRSASQPDYDLAADPDLSAYSASGAADKDIVTKTVYDVQGRVLYTEDVNGERTWQAYDGLGRQVKTIVNAVGTATDDGVDDPRSASYIPSSAPDRDLISETVYDVDGRVRNTVDALGRKQWQVYDAAGRVVKRIQNTSWESGSPAPEDESYAGSSDSDKDLITRTVYDDQGRVAAQYNDLGSESRFEFDSLGRRVKTITNYSNGLYSAEHPDLDLTTVTHYDVAGRVIAMIDPAGIETRFEYDALGRRIKTIANYQDGVYDPAHPSEDIITQTAYGKDGQVLATLDPRGTMTLFNYDDAGRRLSVTRAAERPMAVTDYTSYDKAGRTLRVISNWVDRPDLPDPDEQDEEGAWRFNPHLHGTSADQNLITEFALDALGRSEVITDTGGHQTSTLYEKDGAVKAAIDALGVESARRYDRLRRLTRIVQNHVTNGEDPALWVWDGTDARYEKSGGTALSHGSDNDQNVMVVMEYDKGGRLIGKRDPRGQLTEYEYDLLDRRTALTMLPDDPALERVWQTSYENLVGGSGRRVILTDPMGFATRREVDRLGRPVRVSYLDEAPKLTPDVQFTYDQAGNRSRMSETDSSGLVRETHYQHDPLRRLVAVGFDDDGDSSVEQTVRYEYDAGGLRTKLILPDGLEVVYTYNERGELTNLADWDHQGTKYTYDLAGRLIGAKRSNGLRSRYEYDAGGRLRRLFHKGRGKTLGYFAYDVDARGNRTRVAEALPHPGTGTTTLAADHPAIEYKGIWSAVSDFQTTTQRTASLKVAVFGDTLTLVLGMGPDHGIVEVYINHSFWQGFDCYSEDTDEREIIIPLDEQGPHFLEVRNRREKNLASSGYKARFKELVSNKQYDLHTIQYGYDALSRLTDADYFPGMNESAVEFRQYDYSYDLAGNRTQQVVTLAGAPTTINYTYNALNQLTADGINTYEYDDLGNLWKTNTIETHTWDRVNRLLSFGGVSYAYNGEGQRIGQTVDSVVKQYLLDVQPGLWKVLAEAQGTDTTHYLHGPMGLQSQEQSSGEWVFPIVDALGSVRDVMDADLISVESRLYSPYGEPFGGFGTSDIIFGFTNEPTDANELVHLRARHYDPAIGRFFNQDPSWQEPNLYGYALSNPVRFKDPSGLDGTTGTLVHSTIKTHFLAWGTALGRNVDTEYPVPHGSKEPGDVIETNIAKNWIYLTPAHDNLPTGRADLVDLYLKQVYEIKPIEAWPRGWAEAVWYVTRLINYDSQAWSLGQEYLSENTGRGGTYIGQWPNDPKGEIWAELVSEYVEGIQVRGVIGYRRKQKQDRRVRVPVALLELLPYATLLALLGIAKQLCDQWGQLKPELGGVRSAPFIYLPLEVVCETDLRFVLEECGGGPVQS